MAHITITFSKMHKIAQLYVNVKLRHPGNVITYTPVEFEVFKDKEYYKAVPLIDFQTRILTNLPKKLSFQIKREIIYCLKQSEETVINDLVAELRSLGFLKDRFEKIAEIAV